MRSEERLNARERSERVIAGDPAALAEAMQAESALVDEHWQSARQEHGELGVDRGVYGERLLRSIARLARDTMEAEPDAGPPPWAEIARHLRSDDLYLAAACAAGCPVAWERFELLYGRLIQAIIRSTRVRIAPAEVHAELLAGGAAGGGRIASYRGEGSLIGWLEVVVKRRCIAWRRQEQEPGRWRRASQEAGRREAAPSDPAEEAARDEELEALRRSLLRALGDLDPLDRRLLQKVFFEGSTQKAAASDLGWTEVQVCRRLKRLARELSERVRRDMRDYGGGVRWRPRGDFGRRLGDEIERLLREGQ